MPTEKQARLLTKFGYTYEEIHGWDQGYAGKVLRQLFETKAKGRTSVKAKRLVDNKQIDNRLVGNRQSDTTRLEIDTQK